MELKHRYYSDAAPKKPAQFGRGWRRKDDEVIKNADLAFLDTNTDVSMRGKLSVVSG
jgi:hypothetical protein